MTHSPTSPTNPATPAGERRLCERIDKKGFCPLNCPIRTAIYDEDGELKFYTCYHKINAATRHIAQPADAPAQCPHYEYRDGSYYCHCEYDETHDLAIATAAKAEVLDELKKDLKTRFVSSSNSWSKGRNSGLIECCNIIDEHSRSTPGTQDGERK